GRALPPVAEDLQPSWQKLQFARPVLLANGSVLEGRGELFELIYSCTAGAVVASMLAYLAAQLCDVYLFHFWKNLTGGRHLWLRNNGSTLVSQLVDSVVVVSVTFGAAYLRDEISGSALLALLWSNYLFKMFAALADTVPFYLAVRLLSRYLRIGQARRERPVPRQHPA
ncbi:MAG: queuosine precursor transporter, partial [Acidobacteriota bacterium]